MSRASTTWVTQPLEASARSAEIRRARGAAKAQLRNARGRVAAQLLAAGFLEARRPELEGMRVSELLWSCRGLSVSSAWRLLVRAGIPRESKRLVELTDRQRAALFAALREDADG